MTASDNFKMVRFNMIGTIVELPDGWFAMVTDAYNEPDGIDAVVQLLGTHKFEVMPWRDCQVLGRAENMLEIVARVAETRPDPILFTQNVLQVDREAAEDWIHTAKEEAA